MNNSLRRHHKFFVLLMCLLIHALIALSIIIIQFKDDFAAAPTILFAPTEEKAEKPWNTDNDWVALNNSLPETQYMPEVLDNTQAIPKEMPEMTAEDKSEPFEQTENTEIAQNSEQEKQPEEIAIQESLDEAIAMATQILEQSIPKKEKPLEENKANPKEAPAPQQSNEITLAQVAQGFINRIQEAAMAVKSNNQGPANMDQLKQIHYCQKIIGCLVNSYKINKWDIKNKEQAQRASIHLALNHDGSIHTLRIMQSSGNYGLDQFIVGMFKDASSSFPPVPQSFKKVPFHLPLFNIDRIDSFQTTSGWYIDNTRS